MFRRTNRSVAILLVGTFPTLLISIFADEVSAKSPSQNSALIDDNRIIPVHEKLCTGGVVDKKKLFFQLLANAVPALSDNLKFAVGDWRKLVTDKNICPQFAGCGPKDELAIKSLHLNYTVFVKDGGREGYYRSSNPDLTIGQYFQSADNNVTPIYCASKNELPAAPASSPLDIYSPWRLRGVSDDLWVDQKSKLFAKTSSATVNFTEDDTTVHTHTTKVQAALGYDFQIWNPSVSQEFIPFVSTNMSITDTNHSPRVLPATNFVAGGLLYSAMIQGAEAAHQITLKPQFVDATTMKSQLTSLQAIYAPWTDAVASAPLPPLNTVVNIYPGSDFFPHVNGQLLFDVRADLGFYPDRGIAPYISQNKDFQRFGSKFGFALTATPSVLPTFTLSVTETALYGASGAYRNLSYFDSLLSIYFDPKHYFSANLEYTNGRDENTYVNAQSYKIGLGAKF